MPSGPKALKIAFMGGGRSSGASGQMCHWEDCSNFADSELANDRQLRETPSALTVVSQTDEVKPDPGALAGQSMGPDLPNRTLADSPDIRHETTDRKLPP